MQVKALHHKVKRLKVTLRRKDKYHKVKRQLTVMRLLLDKHLRAILRLHSRTSLHRKAKP